MKSRKPERLGDRELDIMKALWQLGRATVADVHNHLLEAGEQIAYTTIQTMLNRLENKKLVARDQTDRAHRYRPLIKQPKAVDGAIRRLTRRFFEGSAEALAVRLVEKDLDTKQLDRIQALIEAMRQKEAKK